MARAAIPVPLVTAQSTMGDARPLGQPLGRLWELFLASVEAKVRAGELSASRLAQLKATRARCVSLPAYPEPAHVKEWFSNMKGKYSTRRGELWNLLSMYGWAVAMNHSGGNPCYDVRVQKGPPPTRRAVRDIYEKWPRYLDACDALCSRADGRYLRLFDGDGLRARALLGVLRFSGLRIGEALGLHAGDVDTWRQPWAVHVRRQRSEKSLETTERLKTPSSRRVCEVHPALQRLLAPVLELPPARALVGRGGAGVVETPLLFPFSGSFLSRLADALREVGPEDFPPDDRWHVFRHTLAVELRRHGREFDSISKFLGHESTDYTQTYVRGLMPEELTAGIFEGMDAPPPWAVVAARAATTSLGPGRPGSGDGEQSHLALGPMNVVKQKAVAASAPMGVRAPTGARRGGCNPSESEKPQRRTTERLNRVSSL